MIEKLFQELINLPEVEGIVRGVVTYGKQASAHISIYYAMFLYD